MKNILQKPENQRVNLCWREKPKILGPHGNGQINEGNEGEEEK